MKLCDGKTKRTLLFISFVKKNVLKHKLYFHSFSIFHKNNSTINIIIGEKRPCPVGEASRARPPGGNGNEQYPTRPPLARTPKQNI